MCWLPFEWLEKWGDEREGPRCFGRPKLNLASRIKIGWPLSSYVSSGKSRFVNVREATAGGTSRLSIGGNHDGGFPL